MMAAPSQVTIPLTALAGPRKNHIEKGFFILSEPFRVAVFDGR